MREALRVKSNSFSHMRLELELELELGSIPLFTSYNLNLEI